MTNESKTPMTDADFDDFLVITAGCAYRVTRGWVYRWSDPIKEWVSYRKIDEKEKKTLYAHARPSTELELYHLNHERRNTGK